MRSRVPDMAGTPSLSRGAMVAAQAELWIDTPFVWQGRVRGHGCDCKGLVAGIAAELGFAEAASLEAMAGDYGDGAPVPLARLRRGLAKLFDMVPVADRQPGDVLLVKLRRLPQHLAIFAPRDVRPDRAIEAMAGHPGRVRPADWSTDRIDSAWRWREAPPC